MFSIQPVSAANIQPFFEAPLPFIQAKGERNDTPFINDPDLEADPFTTGKKCLDTFLAKGGTFHSLNPFDGKQERFAIPCGSIVYPSCSAGFCRSQTLWRLLLDYSSSITLFSPHATRYGYDPYNQKINWRRKERYPDSLDEFVSWAGMPKAMRIGYENTWSDTTNLESITHYYDETYFSKNSVPAHKTKAPRIYITFVANAHAILKRLNETNDRLDNVTVVHIDLEDLISHPLKEWDTYPLSYDTYAYFAKLLTLALDFSLLKT